MRFQILMQFLVLINLTACKISKGKESLKRPILKLLISCSAGPGKGKLPQYQAEFYGGQKMVFQGIFRTPVTGKFAYLVPEKLSLNLLAEADRLKLSELPDSLVAPEGEQRIRICYLKKDGQYKTISGSVKFAPPAFAEFAKRLQTEIFEMVSDQEGERML